MSFESDNPQKQTTRCVVFAVYDGVTLLDVSGPGEVFQQATALGHPYAVRLVSVGGAPASTSGGIELPAIRPNDLADPIDTLIVPGAPDLPQGQIAPELLELVRVLAPKARRVASVCTGAFVLAELGLFDGRRVATHWRHTGNLARRYPRLSVEPDVLHVKDGNRYSSAGITAGIDLALALVEEDHGAAIARDIARELVMFLQRPGGQSQFSTALSGPAVPEGPLRAVTQAVIQDPAAGHTLESLARVAAVSPRHLTRLFQKQFQTTPLRWVERVRLDRAIHLLLDGASVTAAAHGSGFGSDETLRRVFARHLGTTPSEYRDRFSTTLP